MISGREARSAIASFETEDLAPRLLYVEGVPNVRDLGAGVAWLRTPTTSYAVFSSASARNNFKKVFQVFLDERNYPLLFHCILGRDRTGSTAFIIHGLLGVPLDSLYKDWRVTDFHRCRTLIKQEKVGQRFDDMVASLDQFEGGSLQEKLESFILSLGFTQADIDKLCHLLLETAAEQQ